MPITDIQPRRHNASFTAGTRVVTKDDQHGIVIATYAVGIWILPDGRRSFAGPFQRQDLKRED